MLVTSVIQYFDLRHVSFTFEIMGRHSKEAKRNKQRRQKRKRRERSHSIQKLQPENSYTGTETSEAHAGEQTYNAVEELFAALDKHAEQNLAYWKQYVNELQSYRDVHPAIVTDSNNQIEVYVNGSKKGLSGLTRVSAGVYFSSLHKREERERHMCKVLRDRIEELARVVERLKTRN